ncbi:18525_t:CDS:2, partial [Dentiscutata erythropus]
EYAAPENPETEPKKDRENRLKNKRNAKYRYYQTLEEGNSGPSTRTRSRTSKALSDSRAKTKEGQRDRQQAHRASMSEAKKEEKRRKDRDRYKKQKEEQFGQFYKIGHCSLDEYQEEVKDNSGDDDEDNDGDYGGDDNGDDDGDDDRDDGGDDSDDDDDDNEDGDDKKNIGIEGEKPGLCCINGEVVLAPLQAPLLEILYFLNEKDPISKVPFVNQIRAYNQAFAFTSIATDLDLSVANEKKEAYCYRIQGDHYHQISLALPAQGEIPQFSQIYFHYSSDIEAQIDRRHDVMKQSLNRKMKSIIQNILMDLNPFVDAGNEDLQDPLYYILIHNKHGKEMRQYNASLAKEVAAIWFSD